jgi:peroxidase
MASHRSTKVCLSFSVLLVGMASAHLSSSFYDKSYPEAFSTIKSTVVSAVRKEAIYGN